MRPHTRPARARSAPSRASATRPASRLRLDDPLRASGSTGDRPPGDVSVHVQHARPRPLVRVVGELDLTGAGLLTATLDHVRRDLRRRTGAAVALEDVDVDVDLAAVTFADSHGLAPVLDGRTRIVAASSAVRRLVLLLSDLRLQATVPRSRREARRPA